MALWVVMLSLLLSTGTPHTGIIPAETTRSRAKNATHSPSGTSPFARYMKQSVHTFA